MEIIPKKLENYINNIDIEDCPICKIKLIKYKQKKLIDECYECRYDDRPFAMCRTNRGECICSYEETGIMIIKCLNCEKNMIDKINHIIKINKKIEFNTGFKNKTIKEKLETYGIIKLKILAKNKNILKISKLNKNELIELLIPKTTNNDFPIKDIAV
jgi:hypothetical protein